MLLPKKILKTAESCPHIDKHVYVTAYRTHDMWIKNELIAQLWLGLS